MASKNNIAQLVPHGGMKKIAEKLGITSQAVSLALKGGKPGSRVVQEALRMAKESGALEAQQILNSLKAA